MNPYDFFHHREADAGALYARILCRRAANEFIENARLFLPRYPDTFVTNPQYGSATFTACFDPNGLGIRRILHRILQEIANNTPQRFTIRVDEKFAVSGTELDVVSTSIGLFLIFENTVANQL